MGLVDLGVSIAREAVPPSAATCGAARRKGLVFVPSVQGYDDPDSDATLSHDYAASRVSRGAVSLWRWSLRATRPRAHPERARS